MLCRTPHPNQLQGVVLAGAYPKGGSSFDRLRPRCLMPVAQSPLVAYALRWLSDGGIRKVTLCANSSAPSLRDFLRDEPDLPPDVNVYEDWMPRGTAGCVRDVGLDPEVHTLVVLDATTIPCLDLPDLLAAHQASEAAVTVVAYSDVGPACSGRALNPCGIYVFDRRTLEFVGARGFQDIKETLIPKLHAAGEHVGVHVVPRACPPVLNVETYLAANRWMVTRAVGEDRVPRGYCSHDGALVHVSARVAADARLLGPVMLGPDVVVEEGATIVGPTAIGRGSRIGRGAVVSRTVAWNDCWFGPDSFVDRCLLPDQAAVTPGVSFYNLLKVGLPRRPPVFPELAATRPPIPSKAVPAPHPHW
jgi:NDP-sugar pyrophosphorylase family protein